MAEAERDKYKDQAHRFENTDDEVRDLRRRVAAAESASTNHSRKAERTQIAEANAAAAETDRNRLAEALTHLTAEKDLLVRHSAHTVVRA